MLSVNEQTFVSTVLESPQLVLVYFWAPWCGLCQFVNPLLTKLNTQWGENLKVVDVNADSNFRLANTYRLQSLPTLILFHQGEVIQRLEGFHGREDLNSIQSLVTSQLLTKSL